MNFDFSIESSINKIQNANTKEYFKEVYQTFVNSNYRSSTVMLYSVLICDLVYKMRDLRDLYNDSKAKKILEEIEKMQSDHPNSPEWESKLVELINVRMSLLEPSDIVAIETLQKFRHLSAHPVLSNSDLLFIPNRETVQSLIRNILDGVLTNPPFFSNKIFDTMLLDLSEVKDKITEDEGLTSYVNSRYLKWLKETEFRKVFRSFWKIVFIADDMDATSNRRINNKVLKIFITHNPQLCLDIVKNEPRFFSNVNRDDCIEFMIRLLATFPDFYSRLEEPLKLLIAAKVKTLDEYRFIGWFLKPSLKDHLLSLNAKDYGDIPTYVFKFMMRICEQQGLKAELIDFIINYFGASDGFSTTLRRFNGIICEVYQDFSLEQAKHLLELSNTNNQIFWVNGIESKLQRSVEKHKAEIDFSKYSNIFSE